VRFSACAERGADYLQRVRKPALNSRFTSPTNFRRGFLRNSSARFALGEFAVTLADLMSDFASDETCRALLEKLRWPNTVICPRCHGKDIVRLDEKRFQCVCRYQFSVTAGTIFNDSHLPLQTWFLAVLLIVEARKGMSANQLKRTLGVSYKTAWFLCHRVRAAMGTSERPKLTGKVEMDETYVGGVHKLSVKHLPAYLAEIEFRFNRRKRSDLFVDALRHMVTCDPLSFADLIK
jgi:transposase-like protein